MARRGTAARALSAIFLGLALGMFAALSLAPARAMAAVGWSAVAPMSVARAQQTSTVLADGKVLVAGGYDGFIENVGGSHVSLASAEVFDQATGTWSAAASMQVGRSDQTATSLDDGNVLVVGGWEQPGHGEGSETAEIYDPATNTWSATSPPAELQVVDTATLLGDGDVLVTGLFGPHEYGATVGAAEYLPATGSWVSVTAPPSGAERSRTAALLPGGDVLLLGGWSREGPLIPPQKIYAEAEEFNPATASWTTLPPMNVARAGPTATVLPGGTVLVTGGLDEISPVGAGAGLASTETFDPATKTWAAKAPMEQARGKHTASLLPDGQVLVAGGSVCGTQNCLGSGGSGDCCAANTAELYDPAADSWTFTEPVLTASEHAASVLPDGSVLISGGNFEPALTHELSTAEIYGNLPPSPSVAGPPTPSAPLLSKLRQTRRRWREAGAARPPSRGHPPVPVGTVFSFDLNEPARVTLRFQRKTNGPEPAASCGPASQPSHPSRCHPRTAGTLRLAAHSGVDRVGFAGVLGKGSRLVPGTYSVAALAVAGGSRSGVRGLRFQIVDPSRELHPRREGARPRPGSF